MFQRTHLYVAPATPATPGFAEEFVMAGIVAEDSPLMVERKMRHYKLNQYDVDAKPLTNQYAA